MSDAIAAFAVLYGPATCGCVPLTKTRDAERLTYAQQAKWKDQRGWTRCPICKGSGVDLRIPVPPTYEGIGRVPGVVMDAVLLAVGEYGERAGAETRAALEAAAERVRPLIEREIRGERACR